MRAYPPIPTDAPLPMAIFFADPDQIPPGPTLRPEAIARFDALLHELNPDAVRVESIRIRSLCAWLASLPPETAQDMLNRRLRRLEELRGMLNDDAWDADAALRERLRKLFAYVDQADDLIADGEPLIGKLDDVLLIELAWPAFAIEAEDYRDFCAYRADEHPPGDGGEQRQAWIRDRLAEIALLEHHQRVSDGRYIDRGRPEMFHIG